MAPESEVGSRLRLAASALPLVLMVDKDSPYRDVMRGIELGAVDVLEKPLSSLKLRNIWQHVVRKVWWQLALAGRGCDPRGVLPGIFLFEGCCVIA